MRLAILSFFWCTLYIPVLSQQPLIPSAQVPFSSLSPSLFTPLPPPLPGEECADKADNNGNGLVDQDDHACYFHSVTPADCRGSNIVWISSGNGLYWSNTKTGDERFVGPMTNIIADDISWASNGKLYAADRISGNIFEIDPSTGQPVFAFAVPGHHATNAMTADRDGNLLLASKVVDGPWHILKLQIATGKITLVADLAPRNLQSAGDLTFYNGFLYLTCIDNRMAKINVADGEIQTATIINAPTNSIFGLITLSDGNLYYSNINRLYRLDPITLESTPFYNFQNPGIYALGLTTYGEFCQSPVCLEPAVLIEVSSAAPYCSAQGVSLVANGTGIMGKNEYSWTLPDGSTANGFLLRTKQSGQYRLRYHTVPDTCGAETAIDIRITASPMVDLGPDRLLCAGEEVTLESRISANSTFLWNDGSTSSRSVARVPGIYWLRVTNGCGSVTDTVRIERPGIPDVRLGNDTLICPGQEIVLRNLASRQSWDQYHWSTGADGSEVVIHNPGSYWLEAKNVCSTYRDSITVRVESACNCEPVSPAVDLGIDRDICASDSMLLKNALHSPKFRYRWQDGSAGSSYLVRSPGTYWVDVTASCGTIRDSVVLSPKMYGCTCEVYLPTAFTPNQDGRNELFGVLCGCEVSGELAVFNRWGDLVFVTSDLKRGWDGRFGGRPQPSDVYIFRLRYRVSGSPMFTSRKGTVALIR